MNSTISDMMVVIIKTMGVGFTLNGKAISAAEVFSDVGLMPAIARRADQLSSLCLGYGIGVSFEDEKGTILGSKVKFDDVTPDVLRLACITDVICELVKSAPTKEVTSLDELMYD